MNTWAGYLCKQYQLMGVVELTFKFLKNISLVYVQVTVHRDNFRKNNQLDA